MSRYSRERCHYCGIESQKNVSYRGRDGSGHALANAAGTWAGGMWFCGQTCVSDYWKSVRETDFLNEQWERDDIEYGAFERRARSKGALLVERKDANG